MCTATKMISDRVVLSYTSASSDVKSVSRKQSPQPKLFGDFNILLNYTFCVVF